MDIETGNPRISYLNVFNAINQHGCLLGAIHVIVPAISVTEDQKNIEDAHVTYLFFADGDTHSAKGFALGFQENDQTQIARHMGLGLILSMIPGLSMGIFQWLEEYINEDKNYDPSKDPTSLPKNFYLFRTPEEMRLPEMLLCPGYETMMKAWEVLMEENSNGKFEMIGAQDE